MNKECFEFQSRYILLFPHALLCFVASVYNISRILMKDKLRGSILWYVEKEIWSCANSDVWEASKTVFSSFPFHDDLFTVIVSLYLNRKSNCLKWSSHLDFCQPNELWNLLHFLIDLMMLARSRIAAKFVINLGTI